jgi:hypothetical protein
MMRCLQCAARAGAVLTATVALAAAQTAPASGPAPPDDTPSLRIGVTLFLDYTVTTEPKITDTDDNRVTGSAFNVGRAYLNVNGQISRLIGFRVTPDITRETGGGSSLNGSLTYRLKYAYAQFNLDDWMTPGTWARVGMQQTPLVDFMEGIYRYRFQGTIFEERDAFLSSSDTGASFHYTFSGDYGDLHGGFYNGESYSRAEVNDQKAFMIRGTIRPRPMHASVRGLRLTGFYDRDAYVEDAERRRGVVAMTYEHPWVNAGVDVLSATDRMRAVDPALDSHGFSAWTTPKSPKGYGWEGLLRYDHLVQEQSSTTVDGERNRTIAGIAYWFRRQGAVAAAILFDYERVDNRDHLPARADERRWAVHTLISF